MIPLKLEHTLWSPITLVGQSRGTSPDVQVMLQMRVNQNSPTTSRALRNSGRTLSTPMALPQRSFLTPSATSAPVIEESTLKSPDSASSMFLKIPRCNGGIEEVFEVFLPSTHNCPSRQQYPIPTMSSLDAALHHTDIPHLPRDMDEVLLEV